MTRQTRIMLLNRFYWPDMAATGQMLTDLAEDLAQQDWDVTVIASCGVYASSGSALPREERHNGVRIVRVSATRFGQGSLAGRMGDYLSYLGGALLRLLRGPRPDVVVAMSDPPFLLVPALIAARLRGARTVYWLQDLYPQLAAELGLMRRRGVAYRTFAWMSRKLHATCDAVITLGPQMTRTMVAAGAPPAATRHVDNWADAAAIQPVARPDNPFLREHGLERKFIVLYSGNAGRAHTFDAVIEAMRRLREDAGVVFLFIGGGKKLPEIRDTADREGLQNVRFLDYLPRSELSYSLSAASISLVTENPAVVGLLVPSKTYGILASGRPLVFVGSPESDVAAVVRAHDCGVVVPPDDPDPLVNAIQELRASPERARAMGARGRHAAETIYDRRHATRRWSQTVRALIGEPTDAPAA